MERAASGTGWLLGAGGLLVLVAVGAAGGGVVRTDRLPVPPLPQQTRTPGDGPLPTALPTAAPASPAEPSSAPDLGWLAQAAVVVLAVLLGVLVVLLLRRLLHRDAEPAASVGAPAQVLPEEPAEEAARALRAARTALAADGSARQRVLRCWVGLEEAVAGTGAPRGAGETAGELATRVLAAQVRDPAPLRELHGLYVSARYAPGEVGPAAPERAAALLRAVELDLAGSRAP